MEIKEYIDILVQAPIAAILLFFIYRVLALYKEILVIYKQMFEQLLNVITENERKKH